MTTTTSPASSARAFALPNLLTYARIVAVPVVVGCVYWQSILEYGLWLRWVALFVYIAAGLTDVLDGYVARAYGQLSSFGRIDLHPNLDWQAWRDHRFEFDPQAYEADSHLLTPARCVEAARRVWPITMIRPTLGAYKGALTRPSPKRLVKSLSEVRTKGFNVWRNGTVTAADLAALAEHARA